MHQKQQLGRTGEALAAAFLEKHGYTILESNVLLHQRGEIDIIARKGNYVVCVEVKTRYNKAVPFELLITRSKQRKIIFVARWFAQVKRLLDCVIRFDVIFVDMTHRPPKIEHLINAFWA